MFASIRLVSLPTHAFDNTRWNICIILQVIHINASISVRIKDKDHTNIAVFIMMSECMSMHPSLTGLLAGPAACGGVDRLFGACALLRSRSLIWMYTTWAVHHRLLADHSY